MANYTVKFKHVASLPSTSSLTDDNKGEIYFASNAQMISVWNGTEFENYGGNVLNATYASNILTITKVGGENVVLDFSDVPSADGVNRVLAGLRSDIDNLQTATGIADGATAPSWAGTPNYLTGKTTLKEGIEAIDTQAKTNATAIADEETRAKAAEQANATAITNLQNLHAQGKTVAQEVTAGIDAIGTSTASNAAGSDVVVTVNGEDGKITSVAVDASKLRNDVDTNKTAIATLNGSGTGSIEKSISDAIAELDAEKSQAAGVDGLALSIIEVDGKITSISGSIAAETYDAYGAASAVQGNTAETVASVAADIAALGTAAKKNVLAGTIAASNTSGDLVTAAQVAEFAAGVTGAMHFRGVQNEATIDSSGDATGLDFSDAAAGDVILIGTAEYVFNGSKWQLFGDEGAYEAKGHAQDLINALGGSATGTNNGVSVTVTSSKGEVSSVTVDASGVDSRLDVIEGGATVEGSIKKALADAQGYTDTAIANLDASLVGGDGKYIKSIVEEDGVITAVAGNTNEFDAAGSAAAVLGSSSDDAAANTVYGAKAAVSGEASRAQGVEGALTSLTTSEKGNLVAAINEVGAHADANASAISILNGDATTSGSVAKAVADEASRINAITGNPDTGKTLQGEIDALEALVGTASVDSKISNAINALDATVANTAASSGTTPSSQIEVQVVETDGVLASVSVTAPKFDLDGAAAAVLGTSDDDATDNTVYGAKAYAVNYADTADTQVKADLVGTANDDWSTEKTLNAVANLVANGLAWDWDTTA